jgi:3-dehydroquinate dehydratase/shikimate dehydrogenase
MKPARLCVTVMADTMAELRERRDNEQDADLIELRLDTVREPSVAGALAGRRRPVIITCRPRWEGGHFAGTEVQRHALLAEALALGAEYVDLEWRAGFTDLLAQTGGRRVILSLHDFTGVPADLAATVHAMQGSGAEVVKVSVMASRLSDSLELLALGQRAGAPIVLIAMGDAGLPTRVLAGRFGSCWTYSGSGAAPGQLPPGRLCGEFGFRRISERTAVYGVLGKPVSHSVSPAMHNAAFRAAQLDAVYLPLAADSFDDFLAFAERMGVQGVSVTAPFKVEAFERADECDAVSRRVQSVNTLRRDGPRWLGCNTDVAGFLAPLERSQRLAGLRATVLGAGGAARSVAVALSSANAQVTIAARRRSQAESVCRLTGAAAGLWPPPPGSWDVLVNATPAGTYPDVDAMPIAGPLPPEGLVYDLVYNPPRTRLIAEAERAGCRVIGGLDMLVAQAQAQFEWWTGTRASSATMREAALQRLDDLIREPS